MKIQSNVSIYERGEIEAVIFAEDDEFSTRVKLYKIGLEMKQYFSLYYVLGDDWMFTITVRNIAETAERVVTDVINGKGSRE